MTRITIKINQYLAQIQTFIYGIFGYDVVYHCNTCNQEFVAKDTAKHLEEYLLARDSNTRILEFSKIRNSNVKHNRQS